jgi:hypothetical protein
MNYTQDSPLINPANPFGDSFDTSYTGGRCKLADSTWGYSGIFNDQVADRFLLYQLQ